MCSDEGNREEVRAEDKIIRNTCVFSGGKRRIEIVVQEVADDVGWGHKVGGGERASGPRTAVLSGAPE